MTKKIKLKESIYILKESENVYQVIFTATRKIKRFGVDSLVKETIENLFDVTVKRVHTHIRKGKLKKKGKRMIKSLTPDTKIAYIHVSKGKIDLFPQS